MRISYNVNDPFGLTKRRLDTWVLCEHDPIWQNGKLLCYSCGLRMLWVVRSKTEAWLIEKGFIRRLNRKEVDPR